jgi:phosphatidylinositol dimannoside acyltransferase
MNVKGDATYLAYSAGWKSVRWMPEKSAYKFFDVVADGLWSREGGGVTQLEKNLRRIRPAASDAEIRELSKDSMRRYFRYWCEAFRMPDWSKERVVNTMLCEGEDNLTQAINQNKGVIVALPHMGNWDHVGAWACLTKGPLTSVAERLKPEKLFDKFIDYRSSLGMRIYPLGTPDLMDVLASELRTDHRLLALVSDRDLTARGIDVEFFGEATRMPAGAANLALRTGAPLLPAALWHTEIGSAIRLFPQIEIPDGAPTGDDCARQPGYAEAVTVMTQQVARCFETGINDHPTDWHMMQKLWLADLDPERLAASDAARGR